MEVLPQCNVPGPCGAGLQSNALLFLDRLFDFSNNRCLHSQQQFLPGSKKRSSRFVQGTVFFFGAGVSVRDIWAAFFANLNSALLISAACLDLVFAMFYFCFLKVTLPSRSCLIKYHIQTHVFFLELYQASLQFQLVEQFQPIVWLSDISGVLIRRIYKTLANKCLQRSKPR